MVSWVLRKQDTCLGDLQDPGAAELGFSFGFELSSVGAASTMQGIACGSQQARRREERGCAAEL